ncbi:hypothetical protein QPK87_35565 [Kamptonema cortianum]|uniref:ABC transporter permease n=1 Tax=Geitlerinema calcuttense NRMC-F 0142 TaxID=2922238 RepID=A0ABT7M2L0_9CYAN|nr:MULTISPECIES: hypothetical protein [Cyanophyceae]MDK3161833.1 hypothetical protein [Kamptonema cortianum]MDL5054404.1 hypothetical protein [Oscillatoria laete-virens NRMC-F 0139]MDL5057870.1 hypothetical protein [Geitlerinema calcuttense NRMC-F 0142]
MKAKSAAQNLLMLSPRRIWVIARNTVTELVRQKVLIFLLIFSLCFISSAVIFTQFTFEAQFKFIKDFCLGAMSLMGMILAIAGTASLIPTELDNRTIYTLLAKPVLRLEFLLGKFLGSVLILLVALGLMSATFTGVIFYKEKELVSELRANYSQAMDNPEVRAFAETEEARILKQSRDPEVFKAIVLILVKVVLVAAITLAISSFSTSMIFTILMSIVAVTICHLQSIAQEAWHGTTEPLKKVFLGVVAIIFPDMNKFNLADELVMGNILPWSVALTSCAYGLVMTAAFLAVAWAFFEFREI